MTKERKENAKRDKGKRENHQTIRFNSRYPYFLFLPKIQRMECHPPDPLAVGLIC